MKLTPIWNNPDIYQKKTMLWSFSLWHEKGKKNPEHVLQDGKFISFEEPVSAWISKCTFLEYEQLKIIIQERFNPSELNLEIPTWVSNVLNTCTSKSLYIFDNQLFKIDKSISLPTINWEQNFWTQVRLNTFKMTKSPNIQLIQRSLQNTLQRAKFAPNEPYSVEHMHLL